MKTKRYLPLLLLTATLILSGCKTSSGPIISPRLLQFGVQSAVTFGVAKYPEARPFVKAAEPIICAAAEGTNLAPAQVIEALGMADVLKNPESVFIVNTAMLLYQGIWNAYGTEAVNNSESLQAYLHATCLGIRLGLQPDQVVAATRAQWPMVRWPQ